MEYVTIEGVELVSVGMDWPGANGPLTFRFDHLRDAAKAANEDPLIQAPRIKIGHTDPRFNDGEGDHDPTFDGEPALGKVVNLRLENDGAMLVGDFVEVPRWLGDIMPSAYPSRSIEGAYVDGSWEVETAGGNRYSFVLTAVALLGLARPAVADLEDLKAYAETGAGVELIDAEGNTTRVLGGAGAAARIGDVSKPTAEADVDKVIETFCAMVRSTPEYEWWWPRSMRIDPNLIIADDGDGSLWSFAVQTDEAQQVTFADPERVIEQYVAAPAASRAAVAAAATSALPGEEVAHFDRPPAAAAVTDASWDGAASRFSDEEYERSCVLDRKVCGGDWPDKPPKTRCSLAVREPDGTINRNGVHQAAARFNQTEACAEAKKAAAKRLVSIYRNDLGEEPPEVLTEGAAASASEGGSNDFGRTQGMDQLDHAAELRSVLSLEADASDEQITEALAAHREAAEASTAAGGDEPSKQVTPEPAAASAADGDTVKLDKGAFEKLQRDAEAGALARAEQVKAHQHSVIEQAIKDGKITPAGREGWAAKMSAAPEATEKELGELASGLVPTSPQGSGGSGAASASHWPTDDEMGLLFGVRAKETS